MLRSLRRGPVLLVLAAVALFAVGGAAFTAANTTPNSSAGEDTASTISGFTISSIIYTLDATNPQEIDQVQFTAQSDHAGPWPASLTNMVARFTNIAVEWNVCTDDAGGAAAGTYVITCITTPAALTYFYDGTTLRTQLGVLAAVEFDTVLVQ